MNKIIHLVVSAVCLQRDSAHTLFWLAVILIEFVSYFVRNNK